MSADQCPAVVALLLPIPSISTANGFRIPTVERCIQSAWPYVILFARSTLALKIGEQSVLI
jgi:hypothetical protein